MPKNSGGITAKNVVALALAILVLFGLVAGIWVCYEYTNGFNEDFKTFYLEYEGEKILQSESEMTFEKGKQVRFAVGYAFDFGDEAKDFGVRIFPNEKEQFQYQAGDYYLKWRPAYETEDLSSFFSLKKEASAFTLTFPADMTVEKVLQAAYPGEEIVVDAAALEGKKIYRLEVASYDGSVTYGIDFGVEVRDLVVEVDKDRIVFGGK